MHESKEDSEWVNLLHNEMNVYIVATLLRLLKTLGDATDWFSADYVAA